MSGNTSLNKEESLKAIANVCDQLRDKPRFMVAFWSVDDGVLTYHGKVTHQFPIGDFLVSGVQLLQDMAMEEMSSREAPGPLPMADVLPPGAAS